jgi:hypothetical protein
VAESRLSTVLKEILKRILGGVGVAWGYIKSGLASLLLVLSMALVIGWDIISITEVILS